ncbi:PQQ-binding-like beta-propeller repeat protein [Mucilaginibacter sp.]|uniref:outer membrane protein assembly factor BamB family protein n=1 Tax=Mucilaginibacter sp. TaxID=1882438 RepID=UPI002619CBC1|nr:PQQ-binding-like beta-propeller repeat protein [Mucilaginibacter sp.]
MKPNPVTITKLFTSTSGKAALLMMIFIGYGAMAQTPKKSTSAKKKTSASLIPKQHTEWNDFGGGPDHSKFVDFTQINKQNVTKLEPAFVYSSGDKQAYKFNPIIVDNVMYVQAKNMSLIAINATTGKEIWIHINLRIGQRGINFWQSPDKKQKRLIVTLGSTLQEIDAITGKTILTFGDNGSVDLKQGLDRDPSLFRTGSSTSPGHVYKNLILVGSSPGENLFSGPGHVRAFNILTGKQEWIFHTIPQPGEPGYETWDYKDSYKYVGAINTWGEISVDEKHGIAYFPLGSPTYDYDGADRPGNGLYGNCILALDAKTGKHLWHFQVVHHDIWDYDLTAAPQLITVNHNGKKVEAVAVAGKNGFLYAFNRITGEPLWPIEERPVPKSEMPDEKSSPTQPFPTVIPPFNRHIVTIDDMNPYFTPEEKAKWTTRLLAAKSGPYMPLSDKYEVLSNPGSVGGANYGNTAANPDKGLVYVMFQELSDFYKLKPRPEAGQGMGGANFGAVAGNIKGQIAYAQYCQSCHGADKAGITGGAPTLLTLSGRVQLDAFKSVISAGRGRMPSFPHLEDSVVANIYAYLAPAVRGGRGRGADNATPPVIDGPVVASGGAPLKPGAAPAGPGFGGGGMKDYPEGYTGKRVKYVEASNWGSPAPNILSPPWCGIAAYDLNTGAMKWRIGLGDDAKNGTKGMGLPNGTQNKGMVITKSGLIFATCKDGKLRAIDADNGKILWEYDLQRADTGGIPAMYESNGRQYLVVCSAGGLIDKTKKDEDVPKGYIVFALPKLK